MNAAHLGPAPVEIVTASPVDTHELGRAMGKRAQAGDVFLLTGDLGAGKTTLTQGILWGLGGDEYARSPTFVLVTEYEARLPLYHVDLYRIDRLDELDELGLAEIFDDGGLVVVEWADRAADALPPERLEVHIERLADDSRRLALSSTAPEYDRFLALAASHESRQPP